MPSSVTTAIEGLESNASEILGLLPIPAPSETLAAFAASAVLKFIRVGREIHELGRAKQQELTDRLRAQMRPTLRTQPDPDLQLRRDVERFFVFQGRPNRELRRRPFKPLGEAFRSQIELLASNRRNDPLFPVAIQDLTFAYVFLRPALARRPPRFEDPVLQRYFGERVASRDPLRLRSILDEVRDAGFEQYEHTPNWYRTHLDGLVYWQLATRASLRLSERARAEIQRQLDQRVGELLVDAVFGDDGLFDETLATLTEFKDEKKQRAVDAVDAQLTELERDIEALEANREEAEARLELERRRLTLELETARAGENADLGAELQTELEALDLDWRRREIDFDEELLDLTGERRQLERQKAELEDA